MFEEASVAGEATGDVGWEKRPKMKWGQSCRAPKAVLRTSAFTLRGMVASGVGSWSQTGVTLLSQVQSGCREQVGRWALMWWECLGVFLLFISCSDFTCMF